MFRLRRALIALSLANLTLTAVWSALLIPKRWYLQHPVPAGSAFLVPVAAVCLLAVALLASYASIERLCRPRLLRAAQFAFVAMLLVPLNAVRRDIPLFSADALFDRFGRTPAIVIAVVLAAAAVGAYLRFPGRALAGAKAIVLILVPFIAVTFGQAGWRAVSTWRADPAVTDTQARQSPQRPKVHRGGDDLIVWMVFDELDYRSVFEKRPPSLTFPELDRLASASFTASHAYSPANWTMLAMPALTTGELIEHARVVGGDDLLIKPIGKPYAAWRKQPSVFSRAAELGHGTAVAGWYHPYCGIFGDVVTRCFQPPTSGPRRTFAHDVGRAFSTVVQTLPITGPLGADRTARKRQIAGYRTILDEALNAIHDRRVTLLLLHFPVPHEPDIYDPKARRLSADGRGRRYFDNVALVDETIGTIRRQLQLSGRGSSATLLVTADHGWRTAPDQQAAATDLRVPFVLQLPGQTTQVGYSRAFNTVVTGALLLAILQKEVASPSDVAQWLDRNSRLGKSPVETLRSSAAYQ